MSERSVPIQEEKSSLGDAFLPDLIASAASKVALPDPLRVAAVGEPEHGDIVMARVLEVNPAYPNLETASANEIGLSEGDIILGTLGIRRALYGFSGKLPARPNPGDVLHLLNKGGVIGECTAFHRALGWPSRLEYLGTVVRDGRALNLRDGGLELKTGPLPETPLVLVMGTCMNSGKTAVCKEILRLFSDRGFSVNAGKVAGVACFRDLKGMKEAGAQKVLSFHDFSLASTAQVSDLAPVARSLVHHLADSDPDFIVLEMGDGILGGYQVASLFEDREFLERGLCIVLCANDFMGVWGSLQWMTQQGHDPREHPVLVAGPVTDSAEGIRYIEENLAVPAANVFDSGGKLCTFIRELLMPWSKSA